MKDSFIFYNSYAEAILQLPEKEQLKALWAIINHSLTGEEQKTTGMANIVYTMAKPQIEANNKRFENGKFGAKGGRPKAEEKPIGLSKTTRKITLITITM